MIIHRVTIAPSVSEQCQFGLPDHVRRPEAGEEPHFWSLYIEDDEGMDLHIKDFVTRLDAVNYARDNYPGPELGVWPNGSWDCEVCGAVGSYEDHLFDNEDGACPDCQDIYGDTIYTKEATT